MKWFVASDIHGSEYYCREMLRAFEEEKADRMLLLGDILYHGPRNDLPKEYNPKNVIQLLNARKDVIYCVRGNCDAEVEEMVLEFPVRAEYCILESGKKMIYATHGHIYSEKNLPLLHDGDILLHGHTHIPVCLEHEKSTTHNNYVYMNPGSVSLPKEDSWHGYMTMEDGVFLWKDFDGNIKIQYQ